MNDKELIARLIELAEWADANEWEVPIDLGDVIMEAVERLKRMQWIPVDERSPKEEQEVIDRAKQILMTRNDMSEADAFRYIQKRSMDSGRTMVESAGMILLLNSE